MTLPLPSKDQVHRNILHSYVMQVAGVLGGVVGLGTVWIITEIGNLNRPIEVLVVAANVWLAWCSFAVFNSSAKWRASAKRLLKVL